MPDPTRAELARRELARRELARREQSTATPTEEAPTTPTPSTAPSDPLGIGHLSSALRGGLEFNSFNKSSELTAGLAAGAYAAAKGLRGLFGSVPEGAPSVSDVYHRIRDNEERLTAEAFDRHPGTFIGAGMGSAIALPNPLGKVKVGGQVASAAIQGALGGALGAAGEGGGLSGIVKGAALGGGLGFAAGKLGEKVAARAERAAKRAADAAEATKIEAAVAERPLAIAARKEAIRVGREAEAAAKAGRRTAQTALEEAADVARAARQELVDRAAAAPTKDKALILAGLEGKQKVLGGAERARARATELFMEPLAGEPGETVLGKALSLPVEGRVGFAQGLREAVGAQLGEFRDLLASSPEVQLSRNAVEEGLNSAFTRRGPLTSAQERTAQGVRDLLGELSGDADTLTPIALRQAIREASDQLRTQAGQKQGPSPWVLRQAERVLTDFEKGLVRDNLGPELFDQYSDALRRYGLFSDLEMGARVQLGRVNALKPALTLPRAPRIERGPIPELPPVPRFTPPPEVPQVPGAERLSELRKAFEPTAGRKLAAHAAETLGGAVGAVAGSHAIPGMSIGGAFVGAGLGRQVMHSTVTKRLLQTPTLQALEERSAAAASRAQLEGQLLRALQKAKPQLLFTSAPQSDSSSLSQHLYDFQQQRRENERTP